MICSKDSGSSLHFTLGLIDVVIRYNITRPGKASKFTVVTTNAGAGTLAVHVEGPSKVALVCTEVAEGYEFTYTPMSPGIYMIMIKYSNVTIAGAPFKAVVAGTLLYLFYLLTLLLVGSATVEAPVVK